MFIEVIEPVILPEDSVEEVHIYDLDGTLLRSNGSLLFTRYLKKKGVITQRAWLTCLFREILNRLRIGSMTNHIQAIFRSFFFGKELKKIKEQFDPFWQEQLQFQLRTTLVEEIKKQQERGYVVALFSAAPDFLVRPIATHLKMNYMLATEFSYDSTGTKLEMIVQVAKGELKAEGVKCLRGRFKQAKIFGYSDCHTDRAFLASSDIAYLVAPDSQLKSWANTQKHTRIWSD